MTFSTLGPALKAHGFDPIPILSHDKRPAIDRWQEPRDTAEIERMAANGKSDIPLPQAPPAHPGYVPNAAHHAVARHQQEGFAESKAIAVSQKDFIFFFNEQIW